MKQVFLSAKCPYCETANRVELRRDPFKRECDHCHNDFTAPSSTDAQNAHYRNQAHSPSAPANNPIVAAVFPYRIYYAVHDAREPNSHKMLETLGLNGTNIYRADDQFWDHFTPPWEPGCRCGSSLLTIERASAAGVREAQLWLKTDRPPLQPEYCFSDQFPVRSPEPHPVRGWYLSDYFEPWIDELEEEELYDEEEDCGQ